MKKHALEIGRRTFVNGVAAGVLTSNPLANLLANPNVQEKEDVEIAKKALDAIKKGVEVMEERKLSAVIDNISKLNSFTEISRANKLIKNSSKMAKAGKLLGAAGAVLGVGVAVLEMMEESPLEITLKAISAVEKKVDRLRTSMLSEFDEQKKWIAYQHARSQLLPHINNLNSLRKLVEVHRDVVAKGNELEIENAEERFKDFSQRDTTQAVEAIAASVAVPERGQINESILEGVYETSYGDLFVMCHMANALFRYCTFALQADALIHQLRSTEPSPKSILANAAVADRLYSKEIDKVVTSWKHYVDKCESEVEKQAERFLNDTYMKNNQVGVTQEAVDLIRKSLDEKYPWGDWLCVAFVLTNDESISFVHHNGIRLPSANGNIQLLVKWTNRHKYVKKRMETLSKSIPEEFEEYIEKHEPTLRAKYTKIVRKVASDYKDPTQLAWADIIDANGKLLPKGSSLEDWATAEALSDLAAKPYEDWPVHEKMLMPKKEELLRFSDVVHAENWLLLESGIAQKLQRPLDQIKTQVGNDGFAMILAHDLKGGVVTARKECAYSCTNPNRLVWLQGPARAIVLYK